MGMIVGMTANYVDVVTWNYYVAVPVTLALGLILDKCSHFDQPVRNDDVYLHNLFESNFYPVLMKVIALVWYYILLWAGTLRGWVSELQITSNFVTKGKEIWDAWKKVDADGAAAVAGVAAPVAARVSAEVDYTTARQNILDYYNKRGPACIAELLGAVGVFSLFRQSEVDETLMFVNGLGLHDAMTIVNDVAISTAYLVVWILLLILLLVLVCHATAWLDCVARVNEHSFKSLFLVIVCFAVPLCSWSTWYKVVNVLSENAYGKMIMELRVHDAHAIHVLKFIACCCVLFIAIPKAQSRKKTAYVVITLYGMMVASQPLTDVELWHQHLTDMMPEFRAAAKVSGLAMPWQRELSKTCLQPGDYSKQCQMRLNPCQHNYTWTVFVEGAVSTALNVVPTGIIVTTDHNGIWCEEGTPKAVMKARRFYERRDSEKVSTRYSSLYPEAKDMSVSDFYLDSKSDAIRTLSLYVGLFFVQYLFTGAILKMNHCDLNKKRRSADGVTLLEFEWHSTLTLMSLAVISLTSVSGKGNYHAVLAVRMVTFELALSVIRRFIEQATVTTQNDIQRDSERLSTCLDNDRRMTKASVDRLVLVDAALGVLFYVIGGTTVWNHAHAGHFWPFTNVTHAMLVATVAGFLVLVQLKTSKANYTLIETSVKTSGANTKFPGKSSFCAAYYTIDIAVNALAEWFFEVFPNEAHREKIAKMSGFAMMAVPFVAFAIMGQDTEHYMSWITVSSKSESWHAVISTQDNVIWTDLRQPFAVHVAFWFISAFRVQHGWRWDIFREDGILREDGFFLIEKTNVISYM